MPRVVALLADLIFQSRITAVADALGLELRAARTVADAADALPQAACVLVDITQFDDLPALVKQLRDAQPQIPLIGFLPHVLKERFTEAQAAGFDRVLPRSTFAAQLPDLLCAYAAKT